MGINKETHTAVSVVVTKEIFEELKAIAKEERRSISKQVLFWIEQKIAEDKRLRPPPIELCLPDK